MPPMDLASSIFKSPWFIDTCPDLCDVETDAGGLSSSLKTSFSSEESCTSSRGAVSGPNPSTTACSWGHAGGSYCTEPHRSCLGRASVDTECKTSVKLVDTTRDTLTSGRNGGIEGAARADGDGISTSSGRAWQFGRSSAAGISAGGVGGPSKSRETDREHDQMSGFPGCSSYSSAYGGRLGSPSSSGRRAVNQEQQESVLEYNSSACFSRWEGGSFGPPIAMGMKPEQGDLETVVSDRNGFLSTDRVFPASAAPPFQPSSFSSLRRSSGSYLSSATHNGVSSATLNSGEANTSAEPLKRSAAAMDDFAYALQLSNPFPMTGSGIAEVSRPKRRNVRISKDPQSVAARHRRERISDRMRTLQSLIPNGQKMDTAGMLDFASQYVKYLQQLVAMLSASLPGNFPSNVPPSGFGSMFPGGVPHTYSPVTMGDATVSDGLGGLRDETPLLLEACNFTQSQFLR